MLRHYAGVVAEFMAGKYRDCHALSVWYEKTPSAAPQTAGRVPGGLVPRTRRTILVTPPIKLGLEQQMTMRPRSYRAYLTDSCPRIVDHQFCNGNGASGGLHR